MTAGTSPSSIYITPNPMRGNDIPLLSLTVRVILSSSEIQGLGRTYRTLPCYYQLRPFATYRSECGPAPAHFKSAPHRWRPARGTTRPWAADDTCRLVGRQVQ